MSIRFAIAGLGTAGCMMLPALLKHPDIEIRAAADVAPEPLEQFRQDFQAEVYHSVADLCQSRMALP
jgi:phthalate 4,5-cis-dihydrodiol dehydrogenase